MNLLDKLNKRYLMNSLKRSRAWRDFDDERRYTRALKTECGINIKGEIPRIYLKQAKELIEPGHVINAAISFEEEGDLDGAVSAYLSCRGMKGYEFNRELGELEIKRGNLDKAISYFEQKYHDPSRVIYELEHYQKVSEKFSNSWGSKKKVLSNESVKYQIEQIQKQQRDLASLVQELNKTIKKQGGK